MPVAMFSPVRHISAIVVYIRYSRDWRSTIDDVQICEQNVLDASSIMPNARYITLHYTVI